MRPTFALNLELRPISVNAPKTLPHTFQAGDVFWLTEPFATPYGHVPADTKLFVQQVDEDDGTMWLLAEGDVPALFNWDNMIVVTPYDCDDILPILRAAIRCPATTELDVTEEPKAPLPPSNVRQLGKLTLVACMIAAGMLVPSRITSHNAFSPHSDQAAISHPLEQHMPTSVDI